MKTDKHQEKVKESLLIYVLLRHQKFWRTLLRPKGSVWLKNVQHVQVDLLMVGKQNADCCHFKLNVYKQGLVKVFNLDWSYVIRHLEFPH
jgi:hypothetical protein